MPRVFVPQLMAATLHGAPGTHVQSHVVEEHARAHVHATTHLPEMAERHAQLVVLAMIRRLKLATNKAVQVSIVFVVCDIHDTQQSLHNL